MNKTRNTESAPENWESAWHRREDADVVGALKEVARYTIVVCAVWASFCEVAQAQGAGSLMRQQEQKPPEVPTRPAPEIKQEEPARPAPKPGDTRFMLKGFHVTGNTVFSESELVGLIRDYAGKEVGFADIDQAAARISRYYRERGYMVARAYIPAQLITTEGIVEIAVIEGRFGKVELDNKSRVSDSVARGYLDAFPGTLVTQPALERKMLLLNDLPGVGGARATLRTGD